MNGTLATCGLNISRKNEGLYLRISETNSGNRKILVRVTESITEMRINFCTRDTPLYEFIRGTCQIKCWDSYDDVNFQGIHYEDLEYIIQDNFFCKIAKQSLLFLLPQFFFATISIFLTRETLRLQSAFNISFTKIFLALIFFIRETFFSNSL